MPASRSRSPVANRGSTPRSCMPTRLRLPSMPRGLEEEEHTPQIARRGIESSEKLGRYRWVVKRTLSWMNRNRGLKVRYERRDDIH